jgi:hypothetical protein
MVSNDGSIIAFWQPFAGAVHPCYNDQVVVVHTHAHTLTVADRGSSFNSPADDGSALQWLSPDGRYIAVDTLRPRVLDLRTGTTRHVAGSDAYTRPLAVNATGRYVFWGDTSNSALQGYPLYREDLSTHHGSRADIVAGHPLRQGISTLFGVSDDGRYVAFATDRQDLYVVGPLAQTGNK